MDHNEFDFIEDLIQPFHQFLKQCKIDIDYNMTIKPKKKEVFIKTEEIDQDFQKDGIFRFPEFLYTPPEGFTNETA